MRARLKVVVLVTCFVLGMLFLFYSSLGVLRPPDKPLTIDFRKIDVVILKNSLPQKILDSAGLDSSSWKDYYHTNCCSDIYIDVRTSHQTQEDRLPVILMTWMQTLPPSQVSWILSSILAV